MQSGCMTVTDMSDGHFLSCIAALMHRHPYALIQSSALLIGGHTQRLYWHKQLLDGQWRARRCAAVRHSMARLTWPVELAQVDPPPPGLAVTCGSADPKNPSSPMVTWRTNMAYVSMAAVSTGAKQTTCMKRCKKRTLLRFHAPRAAQRCLDVQPAACKEHMHGEIHTWHAPLQKEKLARRLEWGLGVGGRGAPCGWGPQT